METTGEKIARLRKQMDISQEKLALEIDISRQAISNWENGKREPKTKHIQAL